MKRLYFYALAVGLCCAACEHPDLSEFEDPETGETVPTRKFTFTLKGDFSDDWKPVTRGYLAADGKDLTDVWVLDYMNGQLVQQVHQGDNTAADFGQPTMQLAYGSHHVYFVASRGTTPTLDTEAKTITFGKVLDTFYKDYEVTVVSTSNGNRAVTLDRCVTKLKLIFSDAIPTDAAKFEITPATWYYGINYQTGAPTAAASGQTVTVNIPDGSKGKSGESVNVYGFSTAAEWTADVTLCAKTAGDAVLGSATLTAVPFKANRCSEFTGPLFGSEGKMQLSLGSTWDDSYEGVW